MNNIYNLQALSMKKNIENLSKMNFLISEIFVRSFSEPRILLLSSIENISNAVTKPLELKLHELRDTKIRSRDFKTPPYLPLLLRIQLHYLE
jgi:hypothetical protein